MLARPRGEEEHVDAVAHEVVDGRTGGRRRVRSRRVGVALAVVGLVALAGCSSSGGGGPASTDASGGSSAYPRDGELKLNQMQVLGTHNSYHLRPQEPL